MGICHSAKFVVNDSIPGQDNIAKEVFETLHLTQNDINLIYDIFLQMNKTSTPFLYRSEITSFFRIEEGDLTNRIFDLFAKKSGRLDFTQFVCTMWNFLTLEADDLSTYAFVLFDVDNSGYLSFNEIVILIETIHKKKYSENTSVQTMCDEIRQLSLNISFKQFRNFTKLHPGLCGPLASLQFMMKKQMIGDSFWTKLKLRRSSYPEQTKTGYVAKILKLVKDKYEKLEREKRIRKIQGVTKQKIDEMIDLQSKQEVIERQRNDMMLDFFQLNPQQSKKKKKKRNLKKSRSSQYLRKKSSRVMVMSEEEEVEDDDDNNNDNDNNDEDNEGDEDDNQENNNKDGNNQDNEKENNNNNNENIKNQPSKEKSLQDLSSSSSNQSSSIKPEFISSTSLRRTLIVTKQNSNESNKKLFQPNSIPRKTFVDGVTKVIHAEPPKLVIPPSNEITENQPSSLSSSRSLTISVNSPNESTPERRQTRKQSSFRSNAPLPSISTNQQNQNQPRKTIIDSKQPNKFNHSLPPLERRSTKLQPIV